MLWITLSTRGRWKGRLMVPHCCVSVSSMIVYKKGTQPFGRQTTCTVALCNRTLTVSYCVCVVTCNFLVKKKKIYRQHFSKWTFDPRRPWKNLIFPQTSTHSKVRSQPIESPPAGPLPQMAVSISYIQSVAEPGRGLQPTCFILRLCLEQFRKHLVPVEAALGDGETCFLRGDTETEGETRHRGMRRGSVIEYFVAAVTRRHLIINRSLLWPLLTKRWGDHSPDWGGRDQHGQAARYLQWINQ